MVRQLSGSGLPGKEEKNSDGFGKSTSMPKELMGYVYSCICNNLLSI